MRRRLLSRLVPLFAATALAAGAAVAALERPDVLLLRQRLQHILGSGYQLTEPPQARLHEIIARALRALRDMLGRLSDVEPLTGLPLWTRPVLIGALLVLLALIVGHIVVGLRGLLGGSGGKGRERPHRTPDRAEPRSVLHRAEAAAARGEHDAALVLLYLAVLLRLDHLGLLPLDPSRTNWENLRALRTAPSVEFHAMTDLTHAVDACVYGGRGASRNTWEQARAWADALWRAERPT